MAANNITNSHLWISLEVKKGSSVFLPSTVVAINSDDTFGSILSKVLTPEKSEAQVKKVTISSDVGKHHIVPLDAPAQVIKIASVGH